MQIEKFNSGEKSGYKIIGATFAGSKNVNSRYFDAVEVFADRTPPKDFNFGHTDYSTDYSSGTIVTKNPTAEIKGKILKFSWDLETTNENFIKLIEAENFGGFSPELKPLKAPLKGNKIGTDKNGQPIYEHFYRYGELEWAKTAILAKNQTPGFVGANEYALEKFEAFEDVVIEKVEDKTEDFGVKEDLENQLIWTKRDYNELQEKIKELEIAIKALKNTNWENKLNFSKENNNDELIDQKARLEADIAKLTAEKTKTENFTTLAQNSQGEKLTKGDPVVQELTEEDLAKIAKLKKQGFIK